MAFPKGALTLPKVVQVTLISGGFREAFQGVVFEADFGFKKDAKNGPGEAKLAPRGAQEGTKKHQSDERGDVQKTRKNTWFLSSFGC